METLNACRIQKLTGPAHGAYHKIHVPLLWVQATPSEKEIKKWDISGYCTLTILEIFDWKKPSEMTGNSLLK